MASSLNAVLLVYHWLTVAVVKTDGFATTLGFLNNPLPGHELFIKLVNPFDRDIGVNISAPQISSFKKVTVTVSPKDIYVVLVSTAMFEMTGSGKDKKGIFIESDAELNVIGHNKIENSGDMYFTRFRSQLGRKYVVITHCEWIYHCQFAVVAMADDTHIDVVLPAYFTASVTLQEISYSAGDTIPISLNKSETFQLQSTSDLSGTHVFGTERYFILSGGSCTSLQNNGGRDHLADTAPPIVAWGYQYLIVSRNLQGFTGDLVKIVAPTDGALVAVDGCGTVEIYKISGNHTRAITVTCERLHISSNVAILVAHFPVGRDHGDPAMYYSIPIEQYSSYYLIHVPAGYKQCSVALVAKSMETSTINVPGITTFVTSWYQIGDSAYSSSWTTDVQAGLMEIRSGSPFGGHLLCEKLWTILAIPFGLGNYTINDTEEYSTSTGNDISVTAISTTVPDISTAVPDISTAVPDISTAVPDISTAVPGVSTAVPDISTALPDISTAVPHNSTTVPVDNTPDQTTGTTSPETYVTTSVSTSAPVDSKSKTDDVSYVSNVTTDVTPVSNCSCCKVSWESTKEVETQEVLDLVKELKKTLHVRKNTTTSYIRKHTSAWDSRRSSAGVGTLGVAIIGVVFGSLVTVDIVNLFCKSKFCIPGKLRP